VWAAVASSGLGGTSIGATRYLVNAIGPLAIGSFRFGIGFLLLLPVAWLQGGPWPERRDWLGTAGLGVLYFALFPILFNASLIFTTAARGALALSTLPLLTMLVGAALGRARRLASWSRCRVLRWRCCPGSPPRPMAPGVAIS
jgi:drug/metabolite transporter (DMT)-like permease